MKAVWSLLLTLCTIASACKREEGETNKQAYPVMPASPLPSAVEQPATLPVAQDQRTALAEEASSDIAWQAPSTWQSVPVNNPMRKATYRITRTAGESDDAELAIFHFGTGQGGSIDANVERWLKQFSGIEPDSVKREQRTANGLRQHVIKIDRANYSAGMPGGPQQQKIDWGLLGAIVETSGGNYFFKLTGPAATLKAAEKSFYSLLDSVKAKP
jgi:hypothetical protein